MARVRIGIDVGGTFTDVVVIDNDSHELIGQLKIPTSHDAREGVARGILDALARARQQFDLCPSDVSFIAHSTTQATNALLEGDVAKIGIVSSGSGLEGLLTRYATKVPPIRLTAGKQLTAAHSFFRLPADNPTEEIERAIHGLAQQGVEVIVASQAFGVDTPEQEGRIAEQARAIGLCATTGHEVSSLYGLRVRTRTAVINAAILPKMIATAEMTDRCVQESGIQAPLMIMRSDGGVMNVAEVHRRPILTMLSGPAAGIAGALMHERVSDGIFIEVGGTSADISVIRDGNPITRPARLNGHRMYLNTLDVRTLGVGGGSLIRLAEGSDLTTDDMIIDVGPRSAHIAGLGYACFAEPDELRNATVELTRPTFADAADHAVLRTQNDKLYAITTTCAANFLGYVQPEHFAFGRRESARIAFAKLSEWKEKSPGRISEYISADPAHVADSVLRAACHKLVSTIEDLITEYQLDREQLVLVGGGGGAATLVPYTAKLMNLSHRIARNAEVISPIGVAMAMVRDTVERNIADPAPEDILRVRREAVEAAITAGAVADSLEVQVEVDKRRNLVCATAMGTTELRRRDDRQNLSVEQCREIAARSLRLEKDAVILRAETSGLLVFTGARQIKSGFGLFVSKRQMLRVVDRSGIIRLQRGRAWISETLLPGLRDELMNAIEQLTDFGDAGRTIPALFVLYGTRIARFDGLATPQQVLAMVEVELHSLDPSTKLIVVACPGHI